HAFADHGNVDGLMAVDGGDAQQTLVEFTAAGIDHLGLADQLQRDGAKSFDKSWTGLLASIASKHEHSSAND
ncbi:MAG: transaldolase, partial [Nakamurella sp.]